MLMDQRAWEAEVVAEAAGAEEEARAPARAPAPVRAAVALAPSFLLLSEASCIKKIDRKQGAVTRLRCHDDQFFSPLEKMYREKLRWNDPIKQLCLAL